MEYYLAIIKKKISLCNSMDGPGDHYAKWNKLVKEKTKMDKYHMISLIFGIWWKNWTNKENTDRLMESRWQLRMGEVWEWRNWAKKEKGLIDTDNSVVIAGGEVG